MLNNSKFINERKSNKILCAKLAHVPGLQIKEIIQMSELGIGNKLSVRPSKYSSSRALCLPNVLFSSKNRALVYIKCRLPSSAILEDPELNAVIGLSKLRSFLKRNVEFSVYMLVDESRMLQLVECGKKFNNLKGELGNMLCNYGKVILSREGCYETAHEEATGLVNIAGLNADFILPFDSPVDSEKSGIECSGPVENEFGYAYEKCKPDKFQSEALALRLEEDLLMEVQRSDNCCFPKHKKEQELRLIGCEELREEGLINYRELNYKELVGGEYLEVLREYNSDLCRVLLSLGDVDLRSGYQIGNTGANGRMQVFVSKSSKSKLLVTNNTGAGNLFLFNGRMAAKVVKENAALASLCGYAARKSKNSFVKVKMYFFVEDEKKDEFVEQVFNIDTNVCCNSATKLASGVSMSVLAKYGTLVFSRVVDGPYDNIVNEQIGLAHLSGLCPDFLVEKGDLSYRYACVPKCQCLLSNAGLDCDQILKDLEYDMENVLRKPQRIQVSSTSDSEESIVHLGCNHYLSDLSKSVDNILDAVNDCVNISQPCLKEVSSLLECANTCSCVVRSNTV